MDRSPIEEARFSDTGYSYTLSLISGKYKPVILYCLMEYEPVRFNQMQRYLGRVADKTLSQRTDSSAARCIPRCRRAWSILSRSGGAASCTCWTASATGDSSTGTTRSDTSGPRPA